MASTEFRQIFQYAMPHEFEYIDKNHKKDKENEENDDKSHRSAYITKKDGEIDNEIKYKLRERSAS